MEILFCLIGLGEKELRKDIPEPYSLIRYAGLITQFPRSAMGLKTLLQDAFKGIPVDIKPCITKMVEIPKDQRMYLGISGASLGEDSFIGEMIEDRMGAFRITIGPLNSKYFHDLLPGKKDFERLNFLTKFYLTDPLEYEIEMILQKEDMKTVCLGLPEWSSLGLDTWIFSGDSKEQPITYFKPQNN